MPLNFRIFKKRPTPGKPLAIDGMADALNFMARAWETLAVWKGRVDWNDGRPLIIVDELEDGAPQLDHAFLPTRTGPTEATLTPGYVTDQHGTRRSITEAGAGSATNLWDGGVIDFSASKRWFVRIIYSNIDTGEPLYLLPGDYIEMQWIGTNDAFPQHKLIIGDVMTINIPVIEFRDGDWPSMIRRQTNDILGGEKGLKGDKGDKGDDGDKGPPGDDADCDGLYGPDNPPDYGDILNTPDIPENHSELGDIAGGTADDDHVDSSRGGTGSNVAYLALDEGAYRNAFGVDGEIGDAHGQVVIQPHQKILNSGFEGVGTVEWGEFACKLRSMHDGGLATRDSINWRTRVGYQSDGETISLDWNTQQAAIPIGAQTQDALTDSTGGTPSASGTLVAVGDTSADDESEAINDNLASMAAQLDAARLDIADLKTEITALRDALQAYKIIAT